MYNTYPLISWYIQISVEWFLTGILTGDENTFYYLGVININAPKPPVIITPILKFIYCRYLGEMCKLYYGKRHFHNNLTLFNTCSLWSFDD